MQGHTHMRTQTCRNYLPSRDSSTYSDGVGRTTKEAWLPTRGHTAAQPIKIEVSASPGAKLVIPEALLTDESRAALAEIAN